MCGIVGIWGDIPERHQHILRACERLKLRGPDSQGHWSDLQAQLSLGHVRLAIQDTSSAGHQPMLSPCERFVIVLNGEIYNHLSIRQQLEQQGHIERWRGHSDTETVVAACAAWGIEATLKALEGMFALGLWDRQDRTLTLARDRMGEKPLYYGYAGRAFLFASQPGALVHIPGFDPALDTDALSLYVRHNYVPAPYSIYRQLRKLPPGSWITCSEASLRSASNWPQPHRYWSLDTLEQQARTAPYHFESDQKATDALETCLSHAVGSQMLADVPLGAFLSGGIDSSTIVALMRQHSSHRIQTFAIGFEDPAFNEADHARAVAAHLGTQHTELIVTEHDALAVVPQLARLYDEPFADASQIPTSLVARLARQHVTVALSGDGGDELFAGYSRYARARKSWEQRQRIPAALAPILRRTAGLVQQISPHSAHGRRLARLQQRLDTSDPGAFYRSFVSFWPDPGHLLCQASYPHTPFDDTDRYTASRQDSAAFVNYITQLDMLTYLPDDILAKVDRAAMAASLETRVPLLDRNVVTFARHLPMQYKVRSGQGKWLLRQVLYRHVPQTLIDRPKKGFSVPLGQWLRGPLRDWAHALLDPAHLRDQGLFQADVVEHTWNTHQQGQVDLSPQLWGILMFQAWHQTTREESVPYTGSSKESA